MHVLVVHNRYRSAQPSGENKAVDQEVELLREGGHEVGLFQRHSDDIAARSPSARPPCRCSCRGIRRCAGSSPPG